MKNALIRACEIIQASDFILITAGAGMGVDSGLPDFRGTLGLWKAYPPISKLGLSFAEVSNPYQFNKSPHFAWGFFGHRHKLYSSTTPHEGYHSLKSIVQKKDYFIFTSNVDGHFLKAGFPSEKIAECHGSIHYLQCLHTYKCSLEIWLMSESVKVDPVTFNAEDPLPKCKNCKGLARPNILMFGDYSWVSDRTDLQIEKLEEKLREKMWKICVIEIGAGDAVYTVRAFGNKMVSRYKAEIIRINPDKNIGESNGLHLQMKALEALVEIEKIMRNFKNTL